MSFYPKLIALKAHFKIQLVVLSLSIPQEVAAERHAKLLVPRLNFSIVCLENPREDGWITFSRHRPRFASARYDLLVQLPERPNGPLPFSSDPYKFRLIVGAFPCFYEYTNHRYRGYGTYLNITEPIFGDVQIEDMTFPRVAEDDVAVPVIKEMIRECETRPSTWPYFGLFENCERQVTDDLFSETTSVSIHYDPKNPDAVERLLFVRGIPYLNGKRLYLYPIHQ